MKPYYVPDFLPNLKMKKVTDTRQSPKTNEDNFTENQEELFFTTEQRNKMQVLEQPKKQSRERKQLQ